MGALATLLAAVFAIPHLVRIATRQHLGHQIIIVGCLIARMGVGESVPVVGKDLLEDVPVPRGSCHHRVAPSGGDRIGTVQRLYHTSPAQSTPSSAFIRAASSPSRPLMLYGLLETPYRPYVLWAAAKRACLSSGLQPP